MSVGLALNSKWLRAKERFSGMEGINDLEKHLLNCYAITTSFNGIKGSFKDKLKAWAVVTLAFTMTVLALYVAYINNPHLYDLIGVPLFLGSFLKSLSIFFGFVHLTVFCSRIVILISE